MFEGHEIPFVPFKDYENVKYQDKSFIYGRSGCGKSRIIYEIIKEKSKRFNRVFIINPRHLVGIESHRIGLSKLMNDVSGDDAVIWDNFPDDLLIRDVDSTKEVLGLISSKTVGCLLIALKPKYLEFFRNISDIFEFYKSDIYYESFLYVNTIYYCYMTLDRSETISFRVRLEDLRDSNGWPTYFTFKEKLRNLASASCLSCSYML
ncbi:MAG TPA: hypothetical protein VF884_02415 [Nitrososphaeraceae archaeon]